MLHARPKSLFSTTYEIFDGRLRVAALEFNWFRELGEVVIGPTRFQVGRQAWMSGPFTLRKGGRVITSAVKPSAFRRSFNVQLGETPCRLEAKSAFNRTFELRAGRQVIGSIRPQGVFTRKLFIDLPEDMPLEVRMFLTWLVILMRNRQNKAAAS